MRKIILLFAFLGTFSISAFSQADGIIDTLIWENFDDTIINNVSYDDVNMVYNLPLEIRADSLWYNYDEDGLPDGSGASTPRAGEWFLSVPPAGPDSNDVALASNSWTNDATNPVANWLITPSIVISNGATAVLKWKSAPFQTPRYCDGYEVLVSTGTNAVNQFTTVLFDAAEMTGLPVGSVSIGPFSNYTFSSGDIHGWDGTSLIPAELEFNPGGDGDDAVNSAGDTARWRGVLTEHTVSLAAYNNSQIYIAFKHNSTDDNILYIDDILVIEDINPSASVFSTENENTIAANVFPNPTSDFVNVSFDDAAYTNATIQVLSLDGKVISTLNNVTTNTQVSLANFANGIYVVKLVADQGTYITKVVKK